VTQTCIQREVRSSRQALELDKARPPWGSPPRYCGSLTVSPGGAGQGRGAIAVMTGCAL
jgi:hypothetical protein